MKHRRQLRVKAARLLSVVAGLLAVLIGFPALAQAAPLSKVAPASVTVTQYSPDGKVVGKVPHLSNGVSEGPYWVCTNPVPPLRLAFDLGAARTVGKIRIANYFTAKTQAHANRAFKVVDIFVGDTLAPATGGTPVVAGKELSMSDAKGPAWTELVLDKPIKGRIVTVRVQSNWGGQWYSANEVEIFTLEADSVPAVSAQNQPAVQQPAPTAATDNPAAPEVKLAPAAGQPVPPSPQNRAIQVSATVSRTPPAIQLGWPALASARLPFKVYRKARFSKSWGSPITTLPPTATSWVDTHVPVGEAYEYLIIGSSRYRTTTWTIPITLYINPAGAKYATVDITDPLSGDPLAAPCDLSVTASVAAATGTTVRAVEFYSGKSLIGTVTKPPYSVVLRDIQPGNGYAVSARTIDNFDTVTHSRPVFLYAIGGATPAVNRIKSRD